MTQSLVSKLLAEANKIHKAQMKGTSNYIIASPYFSSDLSGTIRKELRKEKIRLIFND